MGTSHPEVGTVTIEGRKVVTATRNPPLPKRLDALIGSMWDFSVAVDVKPTGATAACDARLHDFVAIREGRYLGPDRILRDLRIEMCPRCGACCVRDVSFDRMAGLPVGRGGLARRDLILGWYSGTRRNQRQYQ